MGSHMRTNLQEPFSPTEETQDTVLSEEDEDDDEVEASDDADDIENSGDEGGYEDGELDSLSSSSSSVAPDENIDFDMVYALHNFVATVEGQSNAQKDDRMHLLDDSHSYWWLVRDPKDGSIGYLPAEHIEMPIERLARLNKHRNVELGSSVDDGIITEVESIMNAKAYQRRKRHIKKEADPLGRIVSFRAPTYHDPPIYATATEDDEDFGNTDEDYDEDDLYDEEEPDQGELEGGEAEGSELDEDGRPSHGSVIRGRDDAELYSRKLSSGQGYGEQAAKARWEASEQEYQELLLQHQTKNSTSVSVQPESDQPNGAPESSEGAQIGHAEEVVDTDLGEPHANLPDKKRSSSNPELLMSYNQAMKQSSVRKSSDSALQDSVARSDDFNKGKRKKRGLMNILFKRGKDRQVPANRVGSAPNNAPTSSAVQQTALKNTENVVSSRDLNASQSSLHAVFRQHQLLENVHSKRLSSIRSQEDATDSFARSKQEKLDSGPLSYSVSSQEDLGKAEAELEEADSESFTSLQEVSNSQEQLFSTSNEVSPAMHSSEFASGHIGDQEAVDRAYQTSDDHDDAHSSRDATISPDAWTGSQGQSERDFDTKSDSTAEADSAFRRRSNAPLDEVEQKRLGMSRSKALDGSSNNRLSNFLRNAEKWEKEADFDLESLKFARWAHKPENIQNFYTIIRSDSTKHRVEYMKHAHRHLLNHAEDYTYPDPRAETLPWRQLYDAIDALQAVIPTHN